MVILTLLFCLLPAGYLAHSYPQTCAVAGGDCVCYHSEAFHQLPPAPNVVNHNNRLSPAPALHGSVPSFLPFTGPTPPTIVPQQNLPGVPVPSNLSMPILQSFHPFQGQSSSTSEENQRRSIVRINSNRPKQKTQQAAKPCSKPSIPNPINTDLTVLLFPVNIR